MKGSWMRLLSKAEASIEYVAARSLIYLKSTLEVLQRRFVLPFETITQSIELCLSFPFSTSQGGKTVVGI
jgi:hypothetical protein